MQAASTPTMPHHQAAEVCTSPRSLAVNRSQSGSKWLPSFPGLLFHCQYSTPGPQHQSQHWYSTSYSTSHSISRSTSHSTSHNVSVGCPEDTALEDKHGQVR